MARFFIDRPIFAWVLALLVMMAGVLALFTLPVAQFPPLRPRPVAITVTYPGASAETVENTVVQAIEQQMSGLDHLLYMSAESDKDGSMTITLTSRKARIQTSPRSRCRTSCNSLCPRLPPAVQQQGFKVAKAAKNFLLAAVFVSTDDSMNAADIADFVASHVQDPVSRTPGVGNFQLFGAQYAMRIWLDPAKLNNYGMTCARRRAIPIKAQNIQVASGELGGVPAVAGQQLDATIIGPVLSSDAGAVRRDPAARRARAGLRCGCAMSRVSRFGGENYRRIPK